MNDYSTELIMAHEFVISHSADTNLMNFLAERRDNLHKEIHSERWSLCYEYLTKNYPQQATGSLITGMAYFLEDNI